jgi:hypothetical protein
MVNHTRQIIHARCPLCPLSCVEFKWIAHSGRIFHKLQSSLCESLQLDDDDWRKSHYFGPELDILVTAASLTPHPILVSHILSELPTFHALLNRELAEPGGWKWKRPPRQWIHILFAMAAIEVPSRL